MSYLVVLDCNIVSGDFVSFLVFIYYCRLLFVLCFRSFT